MTTSLNGWAGIQSAGPALARRVVPGTSRAVTLQADVLPLFLAYLADWHRTVMPIDGSPTYLGPDGWEYRDARTGAGLSNHASGTAVDVRYDVLKADHQRHMTPAQITAVHALLDKYTDGDGRRVFGWGGDWRIGAFCDEMHTELAQSWAQGAHGRNTVLSDVRAVITRLGIRPDGTVATADAPMTVAAYTRPTRGPVIRTARRHLRCTDIDTWREGDDFDVAHAAYLRRHPYLYVAGGRSFRLTKATYSSICKL